MSDQHMRPGISCDVEAGESLIITPSVPGQQVHVTVLEKSGRRTRVCVQSQAPVRIERKKLAMAG